MSTEEKEFKEVLQETKSSSIMDVLNGLFTESERLEGKIGELAEVLQPVLKNMPEKSDEPVFLYNTDSKVAAMIASVAERLIAIRLYVDSIITRVDL